MFIALFAVAGLFVFAVDGRFGFTALVFTVAGLSFGVGRVAEFPVVGLFELIFAFAEGGLSAFKFPFAVAGRVAVTLALGGRFGFTFSFAMVGLLPFAIAALPFGFAELLAPFAPAGLTGPPAALAATTPLPLKLPGFAVAAIAGFPLFTEARKSRFVLASCWCCVCAAVG